MKNEPVATTSSPCLLAERHRDIIRHEPAPESRALLSGLSHCFGIHLTNDHDKPDQHFLTELTGLFQKCRVDPEPHLERHNRRWSNVDLIQYGVPDNQLASWLGVVPATFSGLKRAAGTR